jgi:hypothetical protein
MAKLSGAERVERFDEGAMQLAPAVLAKVKLTSAAGRSTRAALPSIEAPRPPVEGGIARPLTLHPAALVVRRDSALPAARTDVGSHRVGPEAPPSGSVTPDTPMARGRLRSGETPFEVVVPEPPPISSKIGAWSPELMTDAIPRRWNKQMLVKQSGPTCSQGACATLARLKGIDASLDDAFRAAGTHGAVRKPRVIAKTLTDLGVPSIDLNADLSDVNKLAEARKPFIAIVNVAGEKHAIVVEGLKKIGGVKYGSTRNLGAYFFHGRYVDFVFRMSVSLSSFPQMRRIFSMR